MYPKLATWARSLARVAYVYLAARKLRFIQVVCTSVLNLRFLVKISQIQNLELHFRICYKCIPIFRTQTAAHEVIRKVLRGLVWKFLSFYAGIFLI